MTEIFTANTVDEAKVLAAKKFGASVSEISFEIIDEGKKGVLGFGKKDAKVKATYVPKSAPAAPVKAAAAAPKAEVKPAEETPKAEETKPAEAAPEAEEVKPAEDAPIAEEAKPAEAPAAAAEEVKKAPKPEKKHDAPKAEKKPVNEPDVHEDDDAEYSIENFTLIEDENLLHPKVKLAKDYITSILRAMDIDADFTIYQNETGSVINIESENKGTIIGRRGETLDSIQYLCSIIANKGDKDYFRITIDCQGYRNKRKETLEQLAAKVAKSVLRSGKPQPLEPMNPYERRVIHSAIAKIEGVSSRSVGEEPYRRIIISSNNPRNAGGGKGRRGGRNDRSGDRRNNGGKRRERREPNLERRTVDLSTSFEKEYKKPRPEDDIAGGLYGKIEL